MAGLWERVCAEYEAEQHPFPDVSESKHESGSLEAGILQPLHMEQFNSAPAADTDVQQLLPAAETAPVPEPPDTKTCSPQEYIEHYIFPVLLPGLAELLHRAQEEKCFERKRTKFNACDFLTEWLYNKNPKRKDESFTEFFSIPFVKDWLKDHPRPPTPLSLLLSEEAASIVIQSFWRGYRVRCDSEVQELRQWQKQLREEKNITETLKKFWAKQEAKDALKARRRSCHQLKSKTLEWSYSKIRLETLLDQKKKGRRDGKEAKKDHKWLVES